MLIGPAQAAPPGCDTGYFTIDAIAGSVTAGDGFTVTVRAFDCSDAPLTGYAGPATLSGATGSEPGTSPNGDAPEYGTIAWTDGVGTAEVTLYAAETARQITVSDEDLLPATSDAFDVSPGALDSFTIDPLSDATAGTSFTVTATAFDEFGNFKTNYTGGAELAGAVCGPPLDACTPGTSPNGDAPSYGELSWFAGVGTADVTLYKAETARKLSVADGATSATSNELDVSPGPLGAFALDTLSNALAGTSFAVTATALDDYGNVKTDYGGGATLSGEPGAAPGNSPNGDTPSYGSFTWSSGVGTGSATLYKAETGRQLRAADGAATGTSNSFDVLPGPLDSFTVDSLSTATAGTSFTVTATAFDPYGNVKTNYAGGAVVSGATASAPGSSPNGDAPSYGAFTWTSGVGTATVTLYKAETARKLEVADGSVAATSNEFDVLPGPLDSFTFADVGVELGPPTHFVVDVDTPVSVSVTAFDPYGNVKTNYGGGALLNGTLEAQPAPGPGPTYGTLSWSNGVGTASVQAVAMSIDRELTATDGSVAATSNKFDVVAELCTDSLLCEGSTVNGSNKVQLSTPLGDGTAAIGFFNPPGNTIECLLKAGGTTTMTVAGAIALVDPPPGYTADNPLTLTMRLSKEAAPATGVANFLVCLSKDRGETFRQVVDCGKKFRKSEIPCIASRSRTGVGELLVNVLITSVDPWGGIS